MFKLIVVTKMAEVSLIKFPEITWTNIHQWSLAVFTWGQFYWKCSRYPSLKHIAELVTCKMYQSVSFRRERFHKYSYILDTSLQGDALGRTSLRGDALGGTTILTSTGGVLGLMLPGDLAPCFGASRWQESMVSKDVSKVMEELCAETPVPGTGNLW